MKDNFKEYDTDTDAARREENRQEADAVRQEMNQQEADAAGEAGTEDEEYDTDAARQRKLRRYGLFGGIAVAVLILAGIVWQFNGKTIAEMGEELESGKKTQSADKDGGDKATGASLEAAIGEQLDEPVNIASEAAVQAREQLLARQAEEAVADGGTTETGEGGADGRTTETGEDRADGGTTGTGEDRADGGTTGTGEAGSGQNSQNVQDSQNVQNSQDNQGGGTITEEQTPPATQPARVVDLNAYIDEVIRLVNVERAGAGLGPLAKNSAACQGANIRAGEIVSSFSHTRPDGRDCFTVLDELGITYTGCGENIAAGYATPEAVVSGWMNSPGHRANILNDGFEEIGVGVVEAGGYFYWVQLFLRTNW